MEHSPGHTGRNKDGGRDDVGKVLRDVYDRTVKEPVPPEFLDLLGKLA